MTANEREALRWAQRRLGARRQHLDHDPVCLRHAILAVMRELERMALAHERRKPPARTRPFSPVHTPSRSAS